MGVQLRQIGIDIVERRTAKRDRQTVAKSGPSQAANTHRLLKDVLRSRDLQATVVNSMLNSDRFRSLGLLECHGSFSKAALAAIEGTQPVHDRQLHSLRFNHSHLKSSGQVLMCL